MKTKTYSFHAFLARMKYINRWGLMRNSIPENLMEHSLQVATISHTLAIIRNLYYNGDIDENLIVTIALFHDCSEILTGDMPTPIKYYSDEISKSYKEIEEVATKKLLSMLPKELEIHYKNLLIPDKNSVEYELIKAADKISAYVKCIEEEKSGNSEFIKAKKHLYDILYSNNLPEVKYFLDHFVQAYYLSLDELD